MNYLKNILIGRKKLQPFFERLYRISLRGMNYGVGGLNDSSTEAYVINMIDNYYKNEKILVFDIGANKGQYLTMVKEKLKIDAIIHSFEPQLAAYNMLKEKDDGQKIFTHNIALSSHKGKSKIYFDSEGTVWASMHKANHFQYEKNLNKEEEIETSTLDDFCKENLISKIHFCKIDVEGHELDVLNGAKNLILNDQIEFIQFEYGIASTFSQARLRDFFVTLENYNIYRILQNGIYPINYNERYEILLTTNYLAVNKNIVFSY